MFLKGIHKARLEYIRCDRGCQESGLEAQSINAAHKKKHTAKKCREIPEDAGIEKRNLKIFNSPDRDECHNTCGSTYPFQTQERLKWTS